LIDTDTRQLKLGADGKYRSGAGKIICDHCGIRMLCPLSGTVTACEVFEPAIPFQDETGLHKVSNTMRVGVAWTKRLSLGQMIALFNVNSKEVFGRARVIGTYADNIVPMLIEHAPANHLFLETPPKEAAQQLHNWLKQNYGPRIINSETKLTAIYLLRLHGKAAAPNIPQDEAHRTAEDCPPGSR
jgi:hypothetical protein